MKKFLINLVALFATMTVSAQFDGAVGTEGCQAINISNPRIQSWALGVEVTRGLQGNSQTNYASYGKPYNAQGCPDSTTTTCVALGDGGTALITFSAPIIDGEGDDFCVFENGFNSTYLELGFVEVSSDGEHFYRFPATSYTTYNDIRPELLNNIAGKHEVGWGTPFDLSEIEDDEFFNRNNVRYVRIVDIIGGVDTDSQGNVIYDGTSGGPSTGYDLTGVGVLNQGSSYFVADCEGLLTSADTHELISADNGEMDADGNYRLSYLSNGLLYDALGLYGGMFACGFGPSNHTTSTNVTSYSSASLCGLEGAGNTYMIGYYSDWIGTEEHNVVRKEDDTPFYPIGVYVNNSMSAYNYMNTASFANDGHYLNIIATGYDEDGNVTGNSITSLATANNLVKEWKYLDLTPLNECAKVVFTLQTDDDSGYGMNIPAYFCIDAFSYANTLDETTPCETIATFPYFEGFEGISELSENCWTSEIISGTHDWFISQFAVNDAEPFEGSQIAKIFSSTDITRLTTPIFDLTSLTEPYLKFSFVNPQLNWQGENLVVQYKTSSESDWVDLMTINTPHNNWITDSIALPNASDSYQIGFKLIGVNALGAGLDAIHIYDAFTECEAPTDLTLVASTDSEATLSWSALEATAWTLYYKEESQTEYSSVSVTDTTYSITDLNPATSYTAYVVADCAGIESGASNTISFTTDCATIEDFPYYQGFESSPVTCWSTELISGNENWEVISNFSYGYSAPYEGNKMIAIEYTSGSARLTTPIFDLTSLTIPTVKFAYYNEPYSGVAEEIRLQYKAVADDEWTDLMIINTPHSVWTLDSISLPNPTDSYQLSFLLIGHYGNGAAVDAFQVYDAQNVELPEPCDAPTELSVSNITETSADITWNGTATTYEFKLNGGEAETLTTTTKTLTDLTPNTAYTIEVRAICEDKTSEWVSANFTTLEQIVIVLGEVTTSPATNLGNTSATLNGALVSAGESENYTVGFALATVADFTLEDAGVQNITANLTDATFTATVNDLTGGQTYFYRAYITNEAGTAYGAVETFTLLGLTNALANQIAVQLYPNPASDNATLDINGLNQEAKIVISDLQGRILSQDNINAGTTRYTINVSDMTSGVYYIRIITDNVVSTQKLIVE